MLALLTIALLVLTASAVVGLRVARPGFGFGWPTAAIGALLAWVSTFLWQIRLPETLTLGNWLPQSVYTYSPALLVDGLNFPYGLALSSLALAIIWTSAARSATTSPVAWASTLALTALGLLGVLAGNVLTLLLALAAIDLLELVNMLRVADDPVSSESAVIVLSAQLIGLGLILWGALVAYGSGVTLQFDAMPSQGALYLLLGVGVRIAASLYRQPNTRDPQLRRGYETAMRLISMAVSLSVLARIPAGSISPTATSWLLLFAAVTGLISGVYWLRAPSIVAGRRYFLAGMAALAFTAALRGNGMGSAAWGSALIVCGGLASLYTVHQGRLGITLLGTAFVLTALPYSLTASGWLSTNPGHWFFWGLAIPAQALMLAGYVTSVLRPGETSLEHQPNWARAIYPAGLILLATSGLALGLLGWDGARQNGVPPAAIVASLLGGSLGWFFWRIPGLQRAIQPVVASGERLASRPAPLFSAFSGLVWAGYRLVRRLAALVARTLEGEGGLLWTLVLLVLLISIFQVAIR
jgi:hypothetical protein